jgi:hypothetical protein
MGEAFTRHACKIVIEKKTEGKRSFDSQGYCQNLIEEESVMVLTGFVRCEGTSHGVL